MLNIQKRIDLIEKLSEEGTDHTLTYAALECRLTLEYLCYERFKMTYAYLSLDDLKSWRPRDVVKQVSEDVDFNIDKEFTLSVSKESTEGRSLSTKEDYESLEYVVVGTQSGLNLRKIHKLWHGLSNAALHMPVPSIGSGELKLYQDKDNIRKVVESAVGYLRGIKGNLLMAGPLGEVFNFDCHACGIKIKRPVKNLVSPSVVNCITPECKESYFFEPGEREKDIKITRCIFRFKCQSCDEDLDVPRNIFKELRFDQQLNIVCGSCHASLELVMRPLIRTVEEQNSPNKKK
jgi:hypothetical protein